jgi:hypothetical protein
MKICPTCNNQYSDDTLRFCLQDGTPLVDAFDSDTPTVVLDARPAPVTRDPAFPETAGGRRADTVPVASTVRPRSNTALIVALTAVGMLILFAIGGIGLWLYFQNKDNGAANAATNLSPKNVATGTAAPSTTPAKTSTPTPDTNRSQTAPPVDDGEITEQVSARIAGWTADAESLDIDSHMAHYAPVVDYYTKPGSSRSYIRSDKMRAFGRHDSISFDISDISVKTDPSGETATATFDKAWNFDDGASTGKVRQMMQFRKFDGVWLITAEKDIKLYYKQ